MARDRYVIQPEDATYAMNYLDRAMLSLRLNLDDHKKANEDFRAAMIASGKASRSTLLNAWAERYLDAKQWIKLKNAIRKERERAAKGGTMGRTVLLSTKAHKFLKMLAERENITLSEALEKYLPGVLSRPVKPNKVATKKAKRKP